MHRHLLQFAVFLVTLFAFVQLAIHARPFFLAIAVFFLAFPISYLIAFAFSVVVIDPFDLWLRRATRDPVWLMTSEGKKWLATDEGKLWQKAKEP
ncbi:hypothetical protein [Aeoliella sp. SH292]|uniref:hypothetical protein n=1 Tax=Aeoliella sp. SH292 TaxID=3454464 RepID=UPI003F9D3919